MKTIIITLVCFLFVIQTFGQEDNGNIFNQVWYPAEDDFLKGYLVNAGFDVDGDGWGEFLLWDVGAEVYVMFEAHGDNQYQIVYEDEGLLNFFDLDRDGQLELIKIHGDKSTFEQWMTVHEWNGVNFDENFAGGFTGATKTTNRFPRAFWNDIAEGHGFDRGLWDFVNLDGDENWDILAVDAKISLWGGVVVKWDDGTIINILEMTDYEAEIPQVNLRYTSGPIANGMLFFGIWNNFIDIDQDGLKDVLLTSDHTQSLMGIRTAGNDSYDPMVLYKLPDTPFYHLSTWPQVADLDGDHVDELYLADLDGQVWVAQSTGDFASTFQESNFHLLRRIVPKDPLNTNMLMGNRLGDQDGDSKPNFYYCCKDIQKLIDLEYIDGDATDSSSFTVTYTDLVFSNGDPLDASMWHMDNGTRYRNGLLDMDGDNKREIIIGGPDTDYMLTRGVSPLYIYESEHVTSAVEGSNQRNLIPGDFKLTSYPNPSLSHTKIQYELHKPSRITLNIYNVRGQLVQSLEKGPRLAGKHFIIFNTEGLTSGIYIVRLVTINNQNTMKFLVNN